MIRVYEPKPPFLSFFYKVERAKRTAILVAFVLIVFLVVGMAAEEQPIIKFFSATPPEVILGSSSNLSWSAIGATSVYIDQKIGVVPSNGSISKKPTVPTRYTIVAINGNLSNSTSIEINVTRKKPTISYFKAEPEKIGIGKKTKLSWNIQGANLGVSIDQGVGNLPEVGNISVSPVGTTKYTLNATNESGSVTETVSIGCINPVVKLTGPPRILYGDRASLEWNVTEARRISIDQGIGNVDKDGRRDVPPPEATITYTLTASNPCGDEVTNSTMIEVYHEIYGFVTDGEKAIWRSSNGNLPFASSKDSHEGSVALINGLTVGSTENELLLWTHPSWQPNGYIEGVYDLSNLIVSGKRYTPDQRDHISGNFGLLPDSDSLASCGEVTFKVILRSQGIPDKSLVDSVINCRNPLGHFDYNIPPQFIGRPISVVLRVEAGASPDLDHAVWKDVVLLRG